MKALRVAGIAVMLIATQALADQQVRVVDGDTIKVDGVTYRLWGVDAPETHQFCSGEAEGVAATNALKVLMSGKSIACEDRGKDRYGRTIGLCRADGRDLSASMVEEGWAFAFVRYSRDYVALEDRARAENIGVHAAQCAKPWDWRAQAREKR